MPMVTIDPEKCVRDGLCAADCPIALFAMPDKKQPPILVAGAEERCIRCGHCVAVCPHGALAHEAMGPEDCPEVQPSLALTPEHAEHFLRSRRSCRRYKKKPVERESVQKLIDVARYAPSGHNSQPVEWTAILGADKVKALSEEVINWCRHTMEKKPAMGSAIHMDMMIAAWDAGFDAILRDAPAVLVVHSPSSNLMGQDSCLLALAYLELYAPTTGLATCLAGYLKASTRLWPPVRKLMGLPDDHTCYGAAMLGYPVFGHKRMPARNQPQINWI